jgi:hypothetical protein
MKDWERPATNAEIIALVIAVATALALIWG